MVAFVIGLWILNGACSFALGAMPPPDRVADFRAVFYQRSGLGVACILLGIVLLRLRGAPPVGVESKQPGHER